MINIVKSLIKFSIAAVDRAELNILMLKINRSEITDP